MSVPVTFQYGPDDQQRSFTYTEECEDCEQLKTASGSFLQTIMCMIGCFSNPTPARKGEEKKPEAKPQTVGVPQVPPAHRS